MGSGTSECFRICEVRLIVRRCSRPSFYLQEPHSAPDRPSEHNSSSAAFGRPHSKMALAKLAPSRTKADFFQRLGLSEDNPAHRELYELMKVGSARTEP